MNSLLHHQLPSFVKRLLLLTLLGVVAFHPPKVLVAQETQNTDPATVKLNFPAEIELELLIDYVSNRLGVKILYDEEVKNKKISIKAPNEIPADSLLDLLASALKMKDMALVDADIEGWKKIVTTQDLTRIARPGDQEMVRQAPGTVAVTQAFTLTYISPEKLSQIVQPFLTEPGANTIEVPEQNLLIITDYAGNLQRIAQLIETLDQAGPPSVLEFYQVKHVEAATLAPQITQMLSARNRGQAAAGGTQRIEVSHDERTNQLIIVGTRKLVDEVLQLTRMLDVPLGMRTQIYSFEHVDAQRIDNLVKELVDPVQVNRLYRSAIDRDDNLLIVTTTEEIHERLKWLKEEMDVEGKSPSSSVKFYKLKNANAADVLSTLLSIQQTGNSSAGLFGAQTGLRGVSPLGRGLAGPAGRSLGQPFRQQFVPGANFPGTPGQAEPTLPPAQQNEQPQAPLVQTATGAEISFVPQNARVTADQFTNSIIVMGDRSAQEVYKELIDFLDRRRPQVMIEARVVIIDSSDDFSLGVEISAGDRTGVSRFFEFTSFGLSAVDPTNGALSIIPGRGLNWTLVDPTSANAVLKALASHRRARVTSAPRILVNDNSTGTLASVTEVPFTSVNASNTVATTSFAGFAEAGTTIEVLPRISEDDHIVLEYVVSLNSFTGTGGGGVPPPRQTDEVRSIVTIPDGHTVIVGGLTRTNSASTQDGIPFIENIPILRTLSTIRTSAKSRTTLFVFLRPVILRDDKFRDLRYISDKDLRCAGLSQNFPASKPLLIK